MKSFSSRLKLHQGPGGNSVTSDIVQVKFDCLITVEEFLRDLRSFDGNCFWIQAVLYDFNAILIFYKSLWIIC